MKRDQSMNHSKRAHDEHRTMPAMRTLPMPLVALLTVGFLVPRARTWTAELLGLAPPVVCDEECAVVLDEGLLELVLGVLVDVFLVVGDDGLGDGLSDGVDLRGVASARDAHADVDVGCPVSATPFSLQSSICEGARASYRICQRPESGSARRL